MMRLTTNRRFIHSVKRFLLLTGTPGVGKGTYGKVIRDHFNFKHVSPGDEIRKILQSSAPTFLTRKQAEKIREIVKSGGLISDQIVLKLIETKINESQSSAGVILDGFPRTIQQLLKYEARFLIHCVLNFTLRPDLSVEKILGRRVCSQCSEAYNICEIKKQGYSISAVLPKHQGRCDKCSGELVQRLDDNRQVIVKRMKEYQEKTHPLLVEYEKRGVLVSYEPKNGVDDFPEMKRLILNQFDKSDKARQ